MALIFPSNPTQGQLYTSGSSATYEFNGGFWKVVAPSDITVIASVSASYALTGSTSNHSLFAESSSYTVTSSISVSASFAESSSISNTTLYSKGRYAYWAPYVSTDPSGMGATFTAANGINWGENGWQLTTTASDGQNARINWTSNNIDWTKDFKAEVVYFCGRWNTLPPTGDGFSLYMGSGNANVDTYANQADGALKFRLFTYDLLGVPNQGGASFYVGSTKGAQGKTGTDWSTDNWLKFTIEVCWDKITNKRIATAYYDNTSHFYGGKFFIASMDVTSWVPSGNNFGFYCSTGGARSNQYINSISFEAL
jgi:hypothetical protein